MPSGISHSTGAVPYDSIHSRRPVHVPSKHSRITNTTQQVLTHHQNRSVGSDHLSNRSLLQFNKQITSAVRANDVARAWGIFNSIPTTLKPDAYTFGPFLSHYAKRRDISELNRICEIMKNNSVTHSVVTYNTLIDGYAKANRLDGASDFLQQMRGAGIRPDVVTYNALIDGYAKANRLDDAKRFLQQMRDAGIRPDVVTYTTLID